MQNLAMRAAILTICAASPSRQADDRELIERLNSFQDELLQSARLHGAEADRSPSPRLVSKRSTEEAEALSARPMPSGDDAVGSLPPSPSLDDHHVCSGFAEAASGERKALSAAALAAALDLSDLAQAQQRYSSGGAILPILPLGTDDYSVDRGMPTVQTTTERWGVL